MKRITATLLLLCLSVPARAQSSDAAQRLEAADRAYADLDYRSAAEAADKVGKDEQATRGQRARAWEREGLSWLILGQKSLAKESLDHLFELDPDRTVDDPSLSPKQKQFIEDVRTESKAKHPAKVEPKVEPTPQPEPVKAPEHKPVYKKWWLWTTVGVVVVGVGLGVGLGIGLSSGPPKGTLGTVGLGLRW